MNKRTNLVQATENEIESVCRLVGEYHKSENIDSTVDQRKRAIRLATYPLVGWFN